ncbi:MAG TPA: hypothetical protein VFF15_09010 [Flavobacteriaceae bacterium]|nr:hypothetical protein [Flavobacteriaceae bacterium]
MKKVLSILFIAFSVTVFAQEALTEGVVTMKQTMSSPNAEVNAQLAMMGEITSTTYFKGDKSKSLTSSPMTGDVTAIIDMAEKKMLMLMDNPMMGKKYMEQSLDMSEEDLSNINIEKTNETKNVLGYECTKYNVTTTNDGVEVKMEMYVTDKINVVSQSTANLAGKIEGFPMFMTVSFNQMGMDMTQTVEVTEIKKEAVADDTFDMTIPEGYEKGN